MKIRRSLAIFALAALFTTSACGAGESKKTAGVDDKGPAEVTVGFTGALTGSAASWGIGVSEGMKLAFKDAGTVSLSGKPHVFKLLAYDDAYDVQTAVSNAKRLVQEADVKFAVTFGGSGAVATEPVLSSAGVLQLHLGGSDSFLGTDKPLSLRSYAAHLDAVYVYWPWIEQEYSDVKRVAFFEPDDETGRDSRRHEENAVAQTNLTVSSVTMIGRDLTDFYPTLTKVLAKKPDVISAGSVPPGQQAILAKQARELGFKGLLLLPSMDVAAITNALGKEPEKILDPNAITLPSTDKGKDILKRYEETSGKKPTSTFLDGYNMGWLLLQATQKVGAANDPVAVNKAMHEMDMSDSVIGKSCWHEVNGIKNAMFAPTQIAEIKAGKLTLLGTAVPAC